MTSNIIKYALCGIAALVLLLLIFSSGFRTETEIIVKTAAGQGVEALESRLDQGRLALQKFDAEYAKAEQKLISMKHLQLDAQLCMRRAREKAAAYRAQGKEELALRNDEQGAFYQKQLANYEKSIPARTAKLQELSSIRELTKEDVRLARERIAILKATRDTLNDQSGQEEMIEKANGNIANLQSYCNQLSAEIDVLNMEE